jgi:hypothetical protein
MLLDRNKKRERIAWNELCCEETDGARTTVEASSLLYLQRCVYAAPEFALVRCEARYGPW